MFRVPSQRGTSHLPNIIEELRGLRRSLSKNVYQSSVVSLPSDSECSDNSHLREIDAKDRLKNSSETELELLRKEKEELEHKVRVLSTELSSVKEMDENKQKILSMNENELKSLQTTLEENKSTLSARVEDLIKIIAVQDDRYNQERSTLQKGLAERSGQVSTLTAELELCRSTLTTVRGDFSEAQQELMQRSEELTASTMECSALREKLSHIQENDQENSLLNQRINELGSTLLSTEKELVSCRAKLSNQQSEARAVTAQLDRMTAEAQEYRDRAAHLAGTVDESKQTILSMNDELLTLRSTIASLQ
eukprot:gene36886-48113_t